MNEARVLFRQRCGYSPELQALRERIQHTTVTQIGYLDYSLNHYSSYTLRDFLLQHGDSMHGEAPNDIVPILHWALGGLGVDLPDSVQIGIIDRQGRGGGEGSCAIAAHNFVACEMDSTLQRWTAPSSRAIRDDLLRELCLYDYVASKTAGVCVIQCRSYIS